MSHVANVNVATLLLVIVTFWSLMLLHALRWLAVIKAAGSRLDVKTACTLVFIGNFFNQLLPSSIGGDAVRIWCAYRAGMSFSTAANTVIIDHACALFALLLLSAAGLPWLFEIVTDPAARWALSAVIIAGVAGFGVLLALRVLPQPIANWRVARALLGLAALARRTMSQARYALLIIFMSVVSITGFSIIVFLIARAMQIEITLRDCVLLVPPVLLITVVPVSIAGWGVREGAMVVALGFVNVPAGPAFAVSMVFGLILALASLPGSVLCWLSGYSVRTLAADAGALAAKEPHRGV